MLNVDIRGVVGNFPIEANFAIESGVTALFGPSGAGKSTILRAITGLWTPRAGTIKFDGETWFADGKNIRAAEERNIGAVFQRPLLFPHLDVQQNLFFGSNERSGSMAEIVETLDLGNLLTRRPKNLSGGEAQRVALGRALMSNPKLLLLDEPLTGLDAGRREALLPYIEQLCSSSKLPILYVSHNSHEIGRLARRILLVDNGRTIGETTFDKLQ